MQCKNCLVIEFEKFIGPKGGRCTKEEHVEELMKISHFLDIDLSQDELLSIFDSIYGTGPTFRSGQCGGWEESFNQTIQQTFDEYLGDLMAEYGYRS